jgi:anthranilate phosphoribosyltransferase
MLETIPVSPAPAAERNSSEPAPSFKPFVKAVGRGSKLRRDLTCDESMDAMRMIARREATPAQIGGFLIGQRVKGEAETEIRGFTQVIRNEFMIHISPRVETLLDLAVPYDGKVKTAQLAPAVALILAACGLPVVMHGAEGVPTKEGITPGGVLQAMGVSTWLEPGRVAQMVEQAGFGFLTAARFVPAWEALTPLRREFGLRTVLNSVEKLFNPADAPYQVSGFFHGEYIERLRKTHTGTRAGWIVQGEEGSIEMASGRATHIFAEVEADDVILAPASVGLPARERLSPAFDAGAHAQLNLEAVADAAGPASDQAAFTAGVILSLVGAASGVADGLARARQAVRAGEAQRRLEQARRFQ